MAGCTAAFLGGAVIAYDPARGMLMRRGGVMRGQRQGMPMIKRVFAAALALAASACLMLSAEAADPLRIAIQKTGTASWEIEGSRLRMGSTKAANRRHRDDRACFEQMRPRSP